MQVKSCYDVCMKPSALLISSSSAFVEVFKSAASQLDIYTEYDPSKHFDYLYIFASHDLTFVEKISSMRLPLTKTVIVVSDDVPIEKFSQFTHAKILITHDVFGYDESKTLTGKLLKEADKGKVTVSESDMPLYTITDTSLIQAMLEASFSFFADHQLYFQIHDTLTVHELIRIFKEKHPNLSVAVDDIQAPKPRIGTEVVVCPVDINRINNIIEFKYKNTQNAPKKHQDRKALHVSKKVAVSLATFVLIAPVFMFLASALGLYAGYWGIDKNRDISRVGFAIAEALSLQPSFRQSARLGQRVLAVSDSQNIDIASLNPDELREYIADTELKLNTLYKDLSFKKDSFLYSDLVDDSRDVVLLAHDLLDVAPLLLGLNKETHYALVLANGQKITKIYLAEVKDGEVEYIEKFEPSEIDAKLTGEYLAPFNSDIQYSIADIGWESDFDAMSDRLRWFIDKTEGLQIDNVILTDSRYETIFDQLQENKKALTSADFLKELLKIAFEGNLIGQSSNISIQRFLQNEDFASATVVGPLSFYQSEFSQEDISHVDIEKKVEVDATKGEVIYTSLFTNNSDREVPFWTRLTTDAANIFEDISAYKKGSEVVVSTHAFKNNAKKIASSFVTLKPGDQIEIVYTVSIHDVSDNFTIHIAQSPLSQDSSLMVTLATQKSAQSTTSPHMSLTSEGVLGYTTDLAGSFNISVKLEK